MDAFDLDTPLIEMASNAGHFTWTVRHALQGVQVCGGIGSGKSSGSGRMLALKYLAAGFGGLVLTVKEDEAEAWKAYCRLTGREGDLLVLEPGGTHRFNFLDYEAAHASGEEVVTDNLVEVITTVVRAGEAQDAGKSDDPFWRESLEQLTFNVIDLCRLAYGRISVQAMYDIVMTIPKKDEALPVEAQKGKIKAFQQAFEAARANVTSLIDPWFESLPADEQDRLKDEALFEAALLDAVPQARLLKMLDQFFFDNFIGLSEKTRSIIDFTFSGFLFRLLREPVYSLFCRHASTLTPDDCLKGKIILVNLPVKKFQKLGRDCQVLFKYVWQRAMEKRSVAQNGRPVFLYVDEAQFLLHEHDALYQATARSSRIATVYITQNLPNYFSAMGGQRAEHRVKSFLGTLGTKIFHANADVDTNEYASKLIGDAYFEDQSESVTVAQNFSQTRGTSLKLERLVRPEQFGSLRTGGPLNDFKVDGYLHLQGDRLPSGRNHLKMTFNQNYRPQ